jgi:hypothetical protein
MYEIVTGLPEITLHRFADGVAGLLNRKATDTGTPLSDK